MTIIACLYKLYLLLSVFDLVVAETISQQDQQEHLLSSCKCCSCQTETFDSSVPVLGEISWSRLIITCNGLVNFLKFASKKRALHYTGLYRTSYFKLWRKRNGFIPTELEEIVKNMKRAKIQQLSKLKKNGRIYLNKEKRTFEIIHAAIQFDGSQVTDARLTVDCKNADKSKLFCLFDNKSNILKHVTSLRIDGFTHIGVKGKPFLGIFPNLLSLEIKNTARPAPGPLEIYFAKLNNLRDIKIKVAEKHVKLYCALAGKETSLSNPRGLNQFHILLKLGGALEVYGKWKLPAKISSLEIICEYLHWYDPLQMQESEKKQANIFENAEFDNVRLRVAQLTRRDQDTIGSGYRKLECFNILQFSGAKIEKSVTIEGHSDAVNQVLPKVYEVGWQDKLTISYDYAHDYELEPSVHYKNFSYNIPYTEIKEQIFDQSFFSDCNYGKKLLQYARSTVYTLKVNNNKKVVLIIRGFHMTLSAINNTIDEERTCTTCNFKNVDIIRVYAYNIEIDIDPNKVSTDRKIIEFNFMYSGSKNKNLLGIIDQQHVVENVFIWTGLKNIKIKYKDLKMQFIDIWKTRKSIPDPIIMRAFSTCLLINLDSSYDDATTSPTETNPKLSRWYKLIKRSVTFDEKIYTKLDVAHTETANKHLEEYITWRYLKRDDVAKAPFLSLQVLSQNIRTLSGAMKDMIDKRRHFKTLTSLEKSLKKTLRTISNAKIEILKASKTKSESLGDIELKKQKTLNKTIEENKEFQKNLEKKFNNFKMLVRTETNNFKKGVKVATALAIAEAVAEAVDMILSVFSGGFNPTKAMKAARKVKKLKDIVTKLVNVMKTISELLKRRKKMSDLWKKVKERWAGRASRLSQFFKRQSSLLSAWWNDKAYAKTNLQVKDKIRFRKYMDQINRKGQSYERTSDMVNNIVSFTKAERTVRIGFDPGNALDGTGFKHLLTGEDAIKQAQNPKAKEAEEEGKKLSKIDVFKWSLAKEHVTGMIDTTLSDDVPEATPYRTALLKFITTGEARAKASLDKAALETSFSASEFARGLYTKEAVLIGLEIEKTKIALEDDIEKITGNSDLRRETSKQLASTEINLEWEIFSIKLELIRLNNEYCNAFYYFHLEKCSQDLRIKVSDFLDRIYSVHKVLLYQSNEKLRDLYPPPQTFTDHTIVIKKPPNCQCMTDFLPKTRNGVVQERRTSADPLYKAGQRCLEQKGVKYSPQRPGETKKKLKERHHNVTNNIMKECTNDLILNVQKDRQLIYKVDIDSPIFSGYERVRIDEVKVIFKGIKTSNGVLKIYGESTGIYEDRYNGQCFKFIGEKWMRTISYFSRNSLRQSRKRQLTIADWNKLDTKLQSLSANLDTKLEVKLQSLIKNLTTHINAQSSNLKNEVNFIDTADVHKNFQGLFSEPTVFTTWMFNISDVQNPGLNLDGLEEIELKFSGSFVSASYSGSPVQCALKDDEGDNKDSSVDNSGDNSADNSGDNGE